jgi:hypothetical protein
MHQFSTDFCCRRRFCETFEVNCIGINLRVVSVNTSVLYRLLLYTTNFTRCFKLIVTFFAHYVSIVHIRANVVVLVLHKLYCV